MLSTRRRFFEATRSPATAVLRAPAIFPAIVITDSTPPTQPGTPVGTAASSSQIDWTWTASTDSGGSGLAGYRVYVDGALTPTTTVTTNSYSSTGHSASTTHTLRVEAFDNAGNSVSSGTGSQTTQASGGSFTPFMVGTFATGTVGQPANTEYSQFHGSGNSILYANEFAGPFGETKVGKVQLTAVQSSGEYFYGGSPRLPSAIPATTGAEFWARAYFCFPTNWCNGGKGAPPYGEPVNGAIKFFRLFFDTDYRLTLLLGRNDNGPGSFLDPSTGSCASPSVSPVLGFANSEIGSTNSMASQYIVLTRDQWWALQWYVKFGTAGGSDGIFRAWVNSTRVINATNVKTRPPTAPTTVASGFSLPGDLLNGGPGNNNPFYISNIICATSASPPTTLDGLPGSGGVPFIHPSLDARTLQ